MDAAEVEHWDVVVVGAGPAGSSAALAALYADPSLRVLLLDREDFPRDKCCGDGVAPHVVDVLATIGVTGLTDGWEPLHHLELARSTSTVCRPLARPVWVIPRAELDARLVQRATEAGAVLRRHRLREMRRHPGHPGRVLLDDRWSAGVVIGADGAHSQVASWLRGGVPSRGRRALALRGYAPTPAGREGIQVIRYGDRRQPAYAWAFDRGDGLSNIGYGELLPDDADDAAPPTRALLRAQLDALLPGASEGGGHWRGHHLPLSGWRWHQPDGPVLLTGDAAGLINPMTGEGIYYAVATGRSAGQAAAAAIGADTPHLAGGRHRRTVRRALAGHLRHTWTASRLASRPRFVEAGITSARRSQGIFDDLVDLGLGDGRITPRVGRGLTRGLVLR